MLNKLIYKILYKKREYQLNQEVERLKQRVNDLIDELGDPKHVVRKILERDISWYNYKEMKPQDQKGYVGMADAVLRNTTFQNERKHACADLINNIAKETKDFGEVRDRRLILCGIQLMKDRLSDLGVDRSPTKKDLHSSI